jgi:hypothetical protein
MLWVYDIPTWLLFLMIVGGFAVVGAVGFFVTRPLVLWIVGYVPGSAQGVDVFAGAVAVLYGLVAGLIAISVWEQYASVDARVSQEASAMGALYRDALLFPDPPRTHLAADIKGLTYQTMTIMWERQRHGWVPHGKNPYLDGITHSLFTFKPHNLGESDLQLVAENDFQRAYELRRERFYNVSAGVPTALYAVVFFGAGLVIFLTYFLTLESVRLHVAMTFITAAMIGLVVFLIVVMDHPFRGEVSIGPDAFEQSYQMLMVRGSAASLNPYP